MMTQEELMEKFCTNVKAVCKAKELATGVMELKAGMSRGYFSKKELLEDDMWRKTRIAELEAELKLLKEGDLKKDETV